MMTGSPVPGAAPVPVGMRSPERAVAALRIVIGLWFLKTVVTKLGVVLAWGVLPLPGASSRWMATMPKLLTRYASNNPIDFYRSFVLDTVVPHSHTFAQLTAYGETVVGVGLTLGMFTVPASVLGLWLVLNYGLLTGYMGPSQQGFHVLLAAGMIIFIVVRAGRTWGVDEWMRRRWPERGVVRGLT